VFARAMSSRPKRPLVGVMSTLRQARLTLQTCRRMHSGFQSDGSPRRPSR
jgi:hypothetical protein